MNKNRIIEDYLQGKHPIEQESWELPSAQELERDEALFDSLMAKKKAPKRRTLPLILRWTAVAAMVVVVSTIGFRKEQTVQPEQPSQILQAAVAMPEVAPQPVSEAMDKADRAYEANKASKANKLSEANKEKRLSKATKAKKEAEPLPKEEEPVISAEKQALVDIYLAEEALQVAYELQAQQEELRAYVASLTGAEEKPQPQPIIAF